MAFASKEKKEQERLEEARRRSARNRRQADAKAQELERAEQARVQREKDTQDFLAAFSQRIRNTVATGTSVSLFRELYIPVDAQMNEFGPPSGLGLDALNSLGTQGWSLVSVVPRTYGGFESYKVSKTTAYGVSGRGKDEHKVGLGGHVVGVYALLSYTVTQENLGASGDVIGLVAQESLPESLRSAKA